MSQKRLLYGAGATAIVIGGLAIGSLVYAQAPASPEAEANARNTALTAFPGGTILEVETERENGQTVFEVEVRAADGRVFEVEVDATGTQVLETELEDDEDRDDDDGPFGGLFGER